MKKGIFVSTCFAALMLACAMPALTWQGRMAGMGSVYGLVEDESDFLTHPAGIVNGQGFNFYGNMQFGTQTTDKLSYSYRYAAPATPGAWTEWDYDASGREFQYEGFFGGAFPLGKGRMGVFLQYSGSNGELRGDYVGSDYLGATSSVYTFDQEKNFDDLALRILYGIPASSNLKLGAEFQVDYKKDHATTKRSYGSSTSINESYGFSDSPNSLLYLGVPCDSRYYEASMKASMETTIGPAKASFTARGGIPFSSENDYYYLYNSTAGGDHDGGKVKGRSFGADAWIRLPLNGNLSLPFLVTFDYKKLTRKAEGREMLGWSAYYGRHIYRDESVNLTAGGGIDYTPVQGTKIAGGLYYTYLKDTTDFIYAYSDYPNIGSWRYYDNSGFPEAKEHKVSFKGAVEKVISPDLTFSGGFNAFYGRTKQTCDYRYASTGTYTPYRFSSSAKGSHWGRIFRWECHSRQAPLRWNPILQADSNGLISVETAHPTLITSLRESTLTSTRKNTSGLSEADLL
jgi:hypothetical protein